jgi:cysteinyl-tRNA synthetase
MQIYNTLSRKKEPFLPLREGKVGMYVCGPTVYNFIHIGNARPMIVFDVLKRLFEAEGYTVTYVSNFTDVDDKIINKALEEGTTEDVIATRYIAAYQDVRKALNTELPDITPRVTETMDEIIAFIKELVDRGNAYEADGDVYYSTRKFEEYGKLSGQNIDDLESGARIAIGEVKKDPLDFALWKARKEESEIAWESPWGMGRPGWHIECSTMAKKHLGDTIDIHGGGQDLTFPHHENEIAQSEACNGVPFAHYWMHNGYITVDNVKMSKSLGNFFTVRDIRKEYTGDFIRFFLLSGHYRSPINFSDSLMHASKQGYDRIATAIETLEFLKKNGTDEKMQGEDELIAAFDKFRDRFIEVMDDDLNTADAISVIFEMVSEINVAVKDGASKSYAEEALKRIDELSDVLGVFRDADDEAGIGDDIQALIDERQAARKEKNWARADEIRDQLAAMGITLKDTPQGVQVIRN